MGIGFIRFIGLYIYICMYTVLMGFKTIKKRPSVAVLDCNVSSVVLLPCRARVWLGCFYGFYFYLFLPQQ